MKKRYNWKRSEKVVYYPMGRVFGHIFGKCYYDVAYWTYTPCKRQRKGRKS